ncbi:hypothetical protein JCGZ_23280 [Jatropha curcas]|uniref:Pectinesterase inhibitor domain-containing protein n=1 Tax=Jatropha curcas TaxID=180498 RepID=A0A067JHU9_JATCU|nr:hypothetical protein JCGZ_23280 [Jatropha curcas]
MISISHQASQFIIQSCEKTSFKDLCISILGSSKAVDLLSLTKEALEIALSNANGVVKSIPELQNKATNPHTKVALKLCEEFYDDSISYLNDSKKAIEDKAYYDLIAWVTSDISNAAHCEDALTEYPGTSSPMTAINTKFQQYNVIILEFLHLLQKQNY